MRRAIVALIGLVMTIPAHAELVDLGPAMPLAPPVVAQAAPPAVPQAAPPVERQPAPPPSENAQLLAETERGDTGAMIRLARNLETGRGGEFNEAAAATWYRRAAELNDARGAYHLGRLYATGRGVSRSDGEAMAWYSRAASSGVRPAVAAQAQLCFEGRVAGCGPDDGLNRVRAAAQGASPDDLNNMAWQLSWQTTVIGPLLEEAHGMATAAVGAAPNNGYYVGTLGWIELRRAYYDRAIELLQRERQMRGDCDWSCDDRLGDALHAAGRTDEARPLWQRALNAAPGSLDRQVIQTKLRNTDATVARVPVAPRAASSPPRAVAAPVARPPAPPAGPRDVAGRLTALGRLHDQGVITRAEYDEQRRRILNDL